MEKENFLSIIYRVNEKDDIIYVNEEWDRFAKENDGVPENLSKNVLNKKIWSFIDGFETKHLYQAILENVRRYKRTANISIMCDGPTIVTAIDIAIKPLENNFIEFDCAIKKQYERPQVILLDRNVKRSNDFIKMCSYCKVINLENEWLETEKAVAKLSLFYKRELPQISHGISPDCYKNVIDEIERLRQKTT